MLSGETIASGASNIRPECDVMLIPKVLRSGAGWYIGTMCDCGPYSRESGYYASRDLAELRLRDGNYGR